MNKNFVQLSSRFELPYWWVESVAIEYLECREFATRNEIWTFNFDLIREEDLIKAVESERVVVSGPLVHYPQLNRKSLSKSLENYFLGIEDDPNENIIEGLCLKNDFPDEVELMEFWDPKLSFSEYFQVLDGGKFWQWKIAKLIPIKGKSYGKWTSTDVDLTAINDIDLIFRELRNNTVKPGEPGHLEFKQKVEDFYHELKEVRIDVLSELWNIHQKKKENMHI
jgi:hypothetical protein